MRSSFLSPNPAQGSSASRRHWLTGAIASVAALGGVGLAWRIYRTSEDVRSVDPGFWDLEFATPAGESIHMRRMQGKPLLLNFWATWCPPCVQELPLLDRFYREYSGKGWQVLGLAVDRLDPVRRFLMQAPVAFPMALAGLRGVEIARALGNQVGGLPFTVALGADGSVTQRKMGQLTPDDLNRWVRPH